MSLYHVIFEQEIIYVNTDREDVLALADTIAEALYGAYTDNRDSGSPCVTFEASNWVSDEIKLQVFELELGTLERFLPTMEKIRSNRY